MATPTTLRVADDAHQLALEVYPITENFPRPETYGLRAQMRAAAVAVAGNLGGHAGRTPARFAAAALGSAGELRCQTFIARELGYLEPGIAEALEARITEVRTVLATLGPRGRQ